MMSCHNQASTSSASYRDLASPCFSVTKSTRDQTPQVTIRQDPHKPPDVDIAMPAPHPIFPRPLGLSYRNFSVYYSRYQYENGERMEVASRLVADLLAFYFSPPQFSYLRLHIPTQSLIDTVAVPGTIYWIVKAHDENVQIPSYINQDDGIHIKKEDMTGGIKMENETGVVPQGKMILLLAIVTEQSFRRQKAREQPMMLRFSQEVKTSTDHVTIAGHPFYGGQVIVLGSRTGPPRPSWEFYTFQANSEPGNRSLQPWSGQTEEVAHELGTNHFSCSAEDVDNIHSMFQKILKCWKRDRAVPMKLDYKRPALADVTNHARPASKCSMQIADLERIGMRSDGKLYTLKNGRLLKADKEKIARHAAAALGFTFSHSKRDMDDRRSMSRDTTDSLVDVSMSV